MYGYGLTRTIDSYGYALTISSNVCMLLGLLVDGIFQVLLEKFPDLPIQDFLKRCDDNLENILLPHLKKQKEPTTKTQGVKTTTD